jgi:crossover junction endodeoxyribonuclease RuvC
LNQVFIGIDPGAVSGAIAAIGWNGDPIGSYMIEHKDKHIMAMALKSRILGFVEPGQDAQICIEQVFSMPGNGLASAWAFGRAVGAINAICELSRFPVHFVRPQVWKKHFSISADKDEALDLARMLFPRHGLKLKKDINRAEALLIAYYLRDQFVNES